MTSESRINHTSRPLKKKKKVGKIFFLQTKQEKKKSDTEAEKFNESEQR